MKEVELKETIMPDGQEAAGEAHRVKEPVTPEKGEAAQEEHVPEEEEGQWSPEEGAVSNRGLLGKVMTPISASFDSLSNEQKGRYILIVGVLALLIGTALLIKLLVKFIN